MARERIWTEAKDAALIARHRGAVPYALIADELGVSTNAAAGRIATLIRRGVLKARHGKWTKAGERPDWSTVALAHRDSGQR
jgi:hypothetical protein